MTITIQSTLLHLQLPLSTFRTWIQSSSGTKDVPLEIVSLLIVLGVLIAIWDFFFRTGSKLRNRGGMGLHTEIVSLKGSEQLPSQAFSSHRLGLFSRPDALVKEQGILIPVAIKLTAKKVRDRHVMEMLVHLRLIEEVTGDRPPYGILILGAEERRVEIKNTPEKQEWLTGILREMREIIAGGSAVPSPQYYKCRSCDVRKICEHSAYKENVSGKPESKSSDDDSN